MPAVTETDPVVRLETARVAVEPGGQARLTVTVHNPTAVVEGYRLRVLGDLVAEWAEVMPPELRIMPHQEGTAVVVFTPPEGPAAPSGALAFAVLAVSAVDGSRSAAAEGDLDVGRVHGVQAKLTPVTSTGRWSGRHAVSITNWGNAPLMLQLVASDPDQRLGFLVHPPRLEIPVGASATAAVRVRARRPFLRGTPVRLPFQLVGEPDDGLQSRVPPAPGLFGPPAVSTPGRPVLDGALTQRPILSRVFVVGLVLLLAAVGGVGALLLRGGGGPPTQPEVDVSVVAPQSVQVTPTGPTSLQVTWAGTELAESYTVFQIDAATIDQPLPLTTLVVPDIDRQQNSYPAAALEPGREYCFQVSAVREDKQSLRSPPACGSTTAAEPTASPTVSSSGSGSPEPTDPGTTTGSGGAGGTGGATAGPTGDPSTGPVGGDEPGGSEAALPPNEYVVFAGWVSADEGESAAVAATKRLRRDVPTADFVLTTDYPALRLGDGYLLYVPTGTTVETEADSACASLPVELPQGCDLLLRPGERAG